MGKNTSQTLSHLAIVQATTIEHLPAGKQVHHRKCATLLCNKLSIVYATRTKNPPIHGHRMTVKQATQDTQMIIVSSVRRSNRRFLCSTVNYNLRSSNHSLKPFLFLSHAAHWHREIDDDAPKLSHTYNQWVPSSAICLSLIHI